MRTARLIRSGGTQSVQLPRGIRFVGEKVFIKRTGAGLLLLPATDDWSTLRASLSQFTPDFMAQREQPRPQKRRLEFP